MEKVLVAKRPILYEGRQFEVGEHLPAYDKKMVDAWLKANSAEWKGEGVAPAQPEKNEKPEEPAEAPKASKAEKKK